MESDKKIVYADVASDSSEGQPEVQRLIRSVQAQTTRVMEQISLLEEKLAPVVRQEPSAVQPDTQSVASAETAVGRELSDILTRLDTAVEQLMSLRHRAEV